MTTTIKDKLITCLELRPSTVSLDGDVPPKPKTRTWNNLDGSTLITEEYRVEAAAWSNNNNTLENQQQQQVYNNNNNNKIWIAETELQLPEYIQANRTILKVPMQPKRCQAPIKYVMGTKWYVDEMLHLEILKHYEYFIKLDTDVVFLDSEKSPHLDFDLLHDMKIRRAVFAHTGQYPNHIVAPCGNGIVQAVTDFIIQQNQQQQQQLELSFCSNSSQQEQQQDLLHLLEDPSSILSRNADLYYTNFIIGRIDFFQSKQVLQFSRFLAEYPNGFFRHRWTDQIFWHFAMGLFITTNVGSGDGGGSSSSSGGDTRNDVAKPESGERSSSSFEEAVVDYTHLRCAPRKNCWLSVHYYNHDRCDNGGVFFHTKAKQPPTPSGGHSNNSKWIWSEKYSNNFQTNIIIGASTGAVAPWSTRPTVPLDTVYKDQCEKMNFR